MDEVKPDYYDKLNLFNFFWHKRRFIIIKKLLKTIKLSNSLVLDIGCNGGRVTKIIQDITNTYCVGIDIKNSFIEYAKSKNYNKIDFKVMRAEKLNFPAEYFDFITCIEVLEHIKHYNRALNEIRRVLKKNGFLLLCVPNENNKLFNIIWNFWVRFRKVWINSHVNKFNFKSLIKILKAKKFEILNYRFSHFRMLIWLIVKKSA
ncbi:MAG: class I SAM-dependent methyltransferase [Candidatus Aenigmatarchaeota archaeon]